MVRYDLQDTVGGGCIAREKPRRRVEGEVPLSSCSSGILKGIAMASNAFSHATH
ncbi:hypothetical protein KP509_14G048800 [Ceratopteris richardii]|uniref:Uncharacterized protein n=1 Tax=Ceratopteris richardii TaxID=49495 RepID=A0A8T2TCQ4_CERRI|nr:hypothetical protein KP509_14G048800 [Ceratopteris richardii]